jgi:hypothetical protein
MNDSDKNERHKKLRGKDLRLKCAPGYWDGRPGAFVRVGWGAFVHPDRGRMGEGKRDEKAESHTQDETGT